MWVVRGDYTQQHNLAIQMQLATTIWENERMGVEFRAFDFHDAPANSAAANVSEFDQFGISCDGERQFVQTQIGKDADRINVYMVHTVKGDLGQAEARGFGTGFVVIGSAGGDALLAHEIGHNFGLVHIDTLPNDFDETNVMHPASDTRRFTEGQVFRAHLDPLSTLNSLYHARPGQPTQSCPGLDETPHCPPIAKRIWADGPGFPAN